MIRKRFFKIKKAMESEMIGWWLIALAILVIMIIGYFILEDKGINAIEYIKNLLRFRGFGGGASGGGGAGGGI